MSSGAEHLWPDWNRWQRLALFGGLGGLGVAVLGAFIDPGQFFRSYLIAFQCWISLPLGCLAILMLHNLTGGRWGEAIRGALEATAKTLPLFALLFLPIVLGLNYLYSWTDQEFMAGDVRLRHKIAYLNVPFFLVRTAIYFAVWIGLGEYFTRVQRAESSQAEDQEQTPRGSGLGLALYGLAVTFAAIDWFMSLEPRWSSTIFGVMVAMSQVLPALACAILIRIWLTTHMKEADPIEAETWNDLGNLLLAFVMIWAYMSFSQFLLIWCGNLPEEINWYLNRIHGGWEMVAWSLVLFYFFAPFFLLLSRDLKRNPRRLARIAWALLVMHVVFQIWLIEPASAEEATETGGGWPWSLPFALIGIGGLWKAWFFRFLKTRLPVPAVKEMAHG